MPLVPVAFREENLYLRFMKHTLILFSAALLLLNSCGECLKGEGEPISERRTMNAFTAVEAGANIRVMLNQSSAEDGHYVVIETQQNLIPAIVTDLSRGTLKIETSKCVKSSSGILVHVFTPEYQELTLNGTGSLESTAWINSERLKVNNIGTGAMMLDLRANRLEVSNAGTGDVILRGTANALSIDNRGTGSVQAQALRSENAKIDSRGTGDVKLQVHGELDIKLSGTGDVIYEGNPQDIKQSNKGTGKIRRD